MKKYIYLYIFLIPFLLCNFAGASPTITEGIELHQVLDVGETRNFTYIDIGQQSDISIFYFDGIETTTTDKFKVYTFTEEGEYHNVSVKSINLTDPTHPSNLVTWKVTIKREMASTGDIVEFPEGDYDNLTDQLSSGDWEGVAGTSTNPYTELMGKLFYLVLFLLPFGIIWMKQQTMTIPVTLAMILGSVLIGFIPEQYKYFIILMIVMSFGVNLYLLGRDRA